MANAEPIVNHVHNEDLISLRISSRLYSYEYKVFLCHGCPEDRLFKELHRAVTGDATWWAPENTLVITGRQGSLIGQSFGWDKAIQMEDLRNRLLEEVQYDREMLLAIHRTFSNWRFVFLIIVYLIILIVLVGIWIGLHHEGAGTAVTSMLVNLFAAYFHELVRIRRY